MSDCFVVPVSDTNCMTELVPNEINICYRKYIDVNHLSSRNRGEGGWCQEQHRGGGGGRRQLRNMTLPGSEKKRRMDGRTADARQRRRRLKI